MTNKIMSSLRENKVNAAILCQEQRTTIASHDCFVVSRRAMTPYDFIARTQDRNHTQLLAGLEPIAPWS
jgi:hypothetical protein